jgi:PAS domain S-box-containing protein
LAIDHQSAILDVQQNSSCRETSAGVIIYDQGGKVIVSNHYVSKIFGYERDELIGLDTSDLMQLKPATGRRKNSQHTGGWKSVTGWKKTGEKIALDILPSTITTGDSKFTVVFVGCPDKSQTDTFMPFLFLLLDKDGRVLLLNEYGQQILGYGPTEYVGVSWFEKFLLPDDPARFDAFYQKVLKKGLYENYEAPVVAKDGTQMTILWTTAVIYDEKGAPLATLSTGVNTGKAVQQISKENLERIQKLNEHLQISAKGRVHQLANTLAKVENINRDLQLQIHKRKVIEERLIKIQRMYDTMVHNFPDGVIGVLNKEMQYVLVDGQDLHDIDLPALGLSGATSNHPPDLAAVDETLSKLRKVFRGEHVSFEIETRDKTYNVIAVPLPDTHNKINEILCVLRNVTERRRMEDGLRKALEKERELGELKSRFVTMASHEFRTPLTTILSSTFLLENYTGENYEKEKFVHTTRIKRAVNNLTMILNEFLSLEKFEHENVALAISDIDIPRYVKNLIQELELVKKEGQDIEYKHFGDYDHLRVDHKLFWSIVTNLLSNAIKYSKAGSLIKVTTEITAEQLTLTVADAGIGIPEDEHKHIFGRFYRARNATNFEGTGLGLHIIYKYISVLKGSITFESKLDVGTKFIVKIPNSVS